jgi:hypothetical protein
LSSDVVSMDDNGPILVRAASSEENISEGVTVDIHTNTSQQRPLNVSIPDDVLRTVSENTQELQDKLNRFVNGLNSKIQSVRSSHFIVEAYCS